MSKLFLTTAFLIIFSGISLGQKGTAESGYYPSGYGGDTWTGDVTGIDEGTREVTLTYRPDKKPPKTFVAILPVGYKAKVKDGSEQVVEMKNLLGYKVKIYYMTKPKKDANGNKTSVIEILKLSFLGKVK